ncbi:uncharacterized protein DNG_06049 [Cephalotrichum gorgonifer]|uniref:Cnl2/NKP2 family protein n=1 Tax=Cephalotrichum gorgonifer TaxID=2041049 RepID=A0AAE8MYX6_9PEZI|nr:uncharacterized protein DNG_06049 [Cephalotrichum gorgonifer]
MPPTESTILSTYLLLPADLRTIISPNQFAALFPKSFSSSPQIQSLYRDIENQRAAAIATVRENIEAEVKRGRKMRAEVARLRREEEGSGADDEVEIERALFGGGSDLPNSKHTLSSIIPEMDAAVDDLEAEIKSLGEEEKALTESLKQTVGAMSDLRYGRLANSELADDVLQSLERVTAECNRMGRRGDA